MQRKQTTSAKHTPSKRAGSKAADRAPSALEERLLTVGEVARILHISRSLMYELTQRGDLPSVRIGRVLRFRADDIRRYIQQQADPKRPRP